MGGKTLWASNYTRGVQLVDGIPAYLDAENGLNPEFAARASHLNPKRVVLYKPKDDIECLEKAFLKIHNFINRVREAKNKQPIGFIYDSLSVSPSARELRETDLSEDFTQEEWKSVVGNKEQMGERAKIINKELRKLEPTLGMKNVTMLVVQQLRKNIGVMYGKKEVSAVANDAMEYYSCVRLRVSGQKKIENKLKRVIGANLKVANIKNRITSPFMVTEGVQLYYEKGINPLSGLLSVLIQTERVKLSGKGTYKVCEPWAGGQEINFKGSKVNNLVDIDLLLKCPALVDAKDEQEVRDYLEPYGSAIEQTLSDDNVEIEVLKEEAGED